MLLSGLRRYEKNIDANTPDFQFTVFYLYVEDKEIPAKVIHIRMLAEHISKFLRFGNKRLFLKLKKRKTHHRWWVQGSAALSSLLHCLTALFGVIKISYIIILPPSIILMVRAVAAVAFIVKLAVVPSIIMATTAENAIRRLVLSLL